MGAVKVPPAADLAGGTFILDTAAILEGLNLHPASCWTAPSILDEVRAGGPTGRRADYLVAAGLGVVEPSPALRDRVRAVAGQAGNHDRLSNADLDVLAVALERRGTRIEDFDAAIAAHALALDATLVTADLDHMIRVPGLRVEDWGR